MAHRQRPHELNAHKPDRSPSPLADLRAWADDHPGASGLLILLALAALTGVLMVWVTATQRGSEVAGVITAVHLAESDEGSYAMAYVHSPLGDFGAGMPRRSVCRVGSPVRIVVTRDVLGVHQSVSVLTPCLSGP